MSLRIFESINGVGHVCRLKLREAAQVPEHALFSARRLCVGRWQKGGIVTCDGINSAGSQVRGAETVISVGGSELAPRPFKDR